MSVTEQKVFICGQPQDFAEMQVFAEMQGLLYIGISSLIR